MVAAPGAPMSREETMAMTKGVVVITGAGSGLGRALAQRYAAVGRVVACADIRTERAEETVALLGGGPHAAFHCDVADDASMAALAAAVLSRYPCVDVLVNNAGVASGGTMLDSSLDEWRWMLDINVMGVVRGTKAFLPAMLEAGRGRIINIASIAGLAAAPGIMSYGTAKAAVVALSEQLRAEVLDRGLTVHAVCPGFFRTNLTENFKGDPRFRALADKMMDRARETAEHIAAEVLRQSEAGIFLILPTSRERWTWRLKRWFPEVYFRRLVGAARRHVQGATR
jgi:NAD(P)-dependent dehydrogenase (short-subunit alcohol dehydrogenase family)